MKKQGVESYRLGGLPASFSVSPKVQAMDGSSGKSSFETTKPFFTV